MLGKQGETERKRGGMERMKGRGGEDNTGKIVLRIFDLQHVLPHPKRKELTLDKRTIEQPN